VDQGEHVFRFWVDAGAASERLGAIDRDAAARHDVPMVLNVFPSGRGKAVVQGPTLSDAVVQLTATKLSEDGRSLILRLFEPTGTARSTTLTVPALGAEATVNLGPFEIRTLAINLATGHVSDVDLLEQRKP
jgi:alpha-mannosidase